MSKPLSIMLQLFGLFGLMYGWVVEDFVWFFISLMLVIIGGLGIRARRKEENESRDMLKELMRRSK